MFASVTQGVQVDMISAHRVGWVTASKVAATFQDTLPMANVALSGKV